MTRAALVPRRDDNETILGDHRARNVAFERGLSVMRANVRAERKIDRGRATIGGKLRQERFDGIKYLCRACLLETGSTTVNLSNARSD